MIMYVTFTQTTNIKPRSAEKDRDSDLFARSRTTSELSNLTVVKRFDE